MMTSLKILAASVQFSRSFCLAICHILVPVPVPIPVPAGMDSVPVPVPVPTFRGPGLTLIPRVLEVVGERYQI